MRAAAVLLFLALVRAQDLTVLLANVSLPTDVALSRQGALLVTTADGRLLRVDNGVASTVASGFSGPQGVAVDDFGTAYVADTLRHVVWAVQPDGAATVFAGQLGVPGSQDGPPGSGLLARPSSVALDSLGNLYVVDASCAVRRAAADGTLLTVAGSLVRDHCGRANGPGAQAAFNAPAGVAVDSSAFALRGTFDVYVGDYGVIRKLVVSAAGAAVVSSLTATNFSACADPASAQNMCSIQKLALGARGLYVTSESAAPLMLFDLAGNGSVLVPRANFATAATGVAAYDNGTVVLAGAASLLLYVPADSGGANASTPVPLAEYAVSASGLAVAFDVPFAQWDAARLWPALSRALAAAMRLQPEQVLVTSDRPAAHGGTVVFFSVLAPAAQALLLRPSYPSLFGQLAPTAGSPASAVFARWLAVYGLPTAYYGNQPAPASADFVAQYDGATRGLQVALTGPSALSTAQVAAAQVALSAALAAPASVTYVDGAALGGILLSFDVAATVALASLFSDATVGSAARAPFLSAVRAAVPGVVSVSLFDEAARNSANVPAGCSLLCYTAPPAADDGVSVALVFGDAYADVASPDAAQAVARCACVAVACSFANVGVSLVEALAAAGVWRVSMLEPDALALATLLATDPAALVAACQDPRSANLNHPPVVAASNATAAPGAPPPALQPPPPLAEWTGVFSFSVAVDVPVALYRAHHGAYAAAVAAGFGEMMPGRVVEVQDHVVPSASGAGTVVFVDILESSATADSPLALVNSLFVFPESVGSPSVAALLQAMQVRGLPASVVQYVDDELTFGRRRLLACGGAGCAPLAPERGAACTASARFTVVWEGAFDSYASPAVFPQVAYGATLVATGGASSAGYASADVSVYSGDERATAYSVRWCTAAAGAAAWPAALQLAAAGADPAQPPLLYFAGPAYGGLSLAARLTTVLAAQPPVGAWTVTVPNSVVVLDVPANAWAAAEGPYQLAFVAALEDAVALPHGCVFVTNWAPGPRGETVALYYTVELPSSTSSSSAHAGLAPVTWISCAIGALFQGGTPTATPLVGAEALPSFVAAMQAYGLPVTRAYYEDLPSTTRRSLLACADLSGCLGPWQNLTGDASERTVLRVVFACGGSQAVCGPTYPASLAAPVAHSVCALLGCDYRSAVVTVEGGNFVTKQTIDYGVVFYGADYTDSLVNLLRGDAARLATQMSSRDGLAQGVQSVSLVEPPVTDGPGLAAALTPLYVVVGLGAAFLAARLYLR